MGGFYSVHPLATNICLNGICFVSIVSERIIYIRNAFLGLVWLCIFSHLWFKATLTHNKCPGWYVQSHGSRSFQIVSYILTYCKCNKWYERAQELPGKSIIQIENNTVWITGVLTNTSSKTIHSNAIRIPLMTHFANCCRSHIFMQSINSVRSMRLHNLVQAQAFRFFGKRKPSLSSISVSSFIFLNLVNSLIQVGKW